MSKTKPLEEFIKQQEQIESRRDSVVSSSSSSSSDSIEQPSTSGFLKKLFSFRGNFDDLGVAAPLSIIEPESALDAWTKRNADGFARLNEIKNKEKTVERMLQVLTSELENLAYFSHKIKKPLNPLIGETFHCEFIDDSNTKVVIATGEQISHHPPIAIINLSSADSNTQYQHYIQPEFSLGDGGLNFRIREHGSCFMRINDLDEDYTIDLPDIRVQPTADFFKTSQATLFLSGVLRITCKKTGLTSTVNFAKKRFMSSFTTDITGTIKNDNTGESLYQIGGDWKGEMWVKPTTTTTTTTTTKGTKVVLANGSKCPRFSARLKRYVPPVEELDPTHSHRVWGSVMKNMTSGGDSMKQATSKKRTLETWQRTFLIEQKEQNIKHKPKHFQHVNCGTSSNDEDHSTRSTKSSWKLL